MDSQYIKEFIILAEVCNYTEAAEKLFISESTLFRHIKALEVEIGAPLFEKKKSRKIFLSKYGCMFIPYATEILNATAEYLNEVDQGRMEEKSVLLIGTQYRIYDLVKSFYSLYPNTYLLQLVEGGYNKLVNSDCELLVCCDLSTKQEEGFESVVIKEEQLGVVLSKNHVLATRSSIRLEELRREKFVIVSAMRGNEDDYDESVKFCETQQFKPKIIMTAPTGTEVARLVSEGIGVALLYKDSIASAMKDQVVIVDLEPKVKFPITIRWKKDKKLSEVAKLFLDLAVNKY